MASEVKVPRLGWTMEEGVFVEWLKQDGEQVEVGEVLFTLESDKASQDVESIDRGILRISSDGPRAGDVVAVGSVLAYLVEPGETAPLERPTTTAVSSGAEVGSEVDAEAGRTTPGAPAPAAGKAAISPRAARLAAELGVQWVTLAGTGRSGRIRERDVRLAADQRQGGVASRTEAPSASASEPAHEVPVSSLRQTIAERMANSAHTTAPVTLTTTADATDLVELRRQFKTTSPSESQHVPSYTDLIVKLTAVALQDHPLMNVRREGDRIVVSRQVHIGVAVDTDAGLMVPVIRDVPALTIRQLTVRSRELIGGARARRLSPDQMQGGTFTVTNLGAHGVDAFTPIINIPECAILGLGRIRRQPVVIRDDIVARDMISLSLTFDHRVVDGAPAARFLETICNYIEHPGSWLLA